jgi:hypothetical protein
LGFLDITERACRLCRLFHLDRRRRRCHQASSAGRQAWLRLQLQLGHVRALCLDELDSESRPACGASPTSSTSTDRAASTPVPRAKSRLPTSSAASSHRNASSRQARGAINEISAYFMDSSYSHISLAHPSPYAGTEREQGFLVLHFKPGIPLMMARELAFSCCDDERSSMAQKLTFKVALRLRASQGRRCSNWPGHGPRPRCQLPIMDARASQLPLSRRCGLLQALVGSLDDVHPGWVTNSSDGRPGGARMTLVHSQQAPFKAKLWETPGPFLACT